MSNISTPSSVPSTVPSSSLSPDTLNSGGSRTGTFLIVTLILILFFVAIFFWWLTSSPTRIFSDVTPPPPCENSDSCNSNPNNICNPRPCIFNSNTTGAEVCYCKPSESG